MYTCLCSSKSCYLFTSVRSLFPCYI